MDAPFRTRKAALSSRSPSVWPGCRGDGRCRPCGGVHDVGGYGYERGERVHVADVRCLENHLRGCPDPLPNPLHDLNRAGNCRVCKAHVPRTARGYVRAITEAADPKEVERVRRRT